MSMWMSMWMRMRMRMKTGLNGFWFESKIGVYVRELILIRMDFDSNENRFRLVPIGWYRLELMIRPQITQIAEITQLRLPGFWDYPVHVLQFKMYFFVRTYSRTVYFIIMDVLCSFSILFDSSIIRTDIQKDIITSLLGYFFICLSSFVISTFSIKLENQCFIL